MKGFIDILDIVKLDKKYRLNFDRYKLSRTKLRITIWLPNSLDI